MNSAKGEPGLSPILERAEAGYPLSGDEVVRLLSIVEHRDMRALFSAARRVRDKHSGNKVFLYGFVYLSTYCRNDCAFCYYRASNTHSLRYRKTPDQIVEAATLLADSDVHLIDLTMGEDPAYFRDRGFEGLAASVASVKQATELPIMVSPGLVDEATLRMLKDSGASWYACYQETHDRSLFAKIRPGQDFDSRLDAKKTARKLGLLTEDGILSGLGESPADVANNLAAMGKLGVDQLRVMSFVPQKGTPLAAHPPADSRDELKIIAVMRLLYPDRLIPASLDVGGLVGLQVRLNAGANVITSLVPPGEGLAGVAQSSLDIDDARRTVASVEPVLRECNLNPATTTEYRRWIEDKLKSVGTGAAGHGRSAGADQC